MRVFLSYSRADSEVAESIAKCLDENDCKVWWDRKIAAGQRLENVISAQFDLADVVVVIWTSDSVGSPWVLDEANHGFRLDKLLPLKLERLEHAQIPKPFGVLHTGLAESEQDLLAAVQSYRNKAEPIKADNFDSGASGETLDEEAPDQSQENDKDQEANQSWFVNDQYFEIVTRHSKQMSRKASAVELVIEAKEAIFDSEIDSFSEKIANLHSAVEKSTTVLIKAARTNLAARMFRLFPRRKGVVARQAVQTIDSCIERIFDEVLGAEHRLLKNLLSLDCHMYSSGLFEISSSKTGLSDLYNEQRKKLPLLSVVEPPQKSFVLMDRSGSTGEDRELLLRVLAARNGLAKYCDSEFFSKKYMASWNEDLGAIFVPLPHLNELNDDQGILNIINTHVRSGRIEPKVIERKFREVFASTFAARVMIDFTRSSLKGAFDE